MCMVSFPSCLAGFWGFHPYMYLFSFGKLFCDLLLTEDCGSWQLQLSSRALATPARINSWWLPAFHFLLLFHNIVCVCFVTIRSRATNYRWIYHPNCTFQNCCILLYWEHKKLLNRLSCLSLQVDRRGIREHIHGNHDSDGNAWCHVGRWSGSYQVTANCFWQCPPEINYWWLSPVFTGYKTVFELIQDHGDRYPAGPQVRGST